MFGDSVIRGNGVCRLKHRDFYPGNNLSQHILKLAEDSLKWRATGNDIENFTLSCQEPPFDRVFTSRSVAQPST